MFSPRSTPAAVGQRTIFVVNDATELLELLAMIARLTGAGASPGPGGDGHVAG